MSPDFEHRRSSFDVAGTISESRVEEARVVNSELAVRWIERNHLGREVGRHAHPLLGCKYVKVPRFENEILTSILITNFPEFFRRIKVNLVQFDGRCIPL